MSNAAAKVFIQVESAAEQEEHLKNQRKTLKVLQSGATDKENLAGRPNIDKLSRIKAAADVTLASFDQPKRKKVELQAAETQTSPQKGNEEITVKDLTGSENPGEFYWERLAEQRRRALEETLAENHNLHDKIDSLEEELNTSRQMLEEARNLVDVLTEILNETEARREMGADMGSDMGSDQVDLEPSAEDQCRYESFNEALFEENRIAYDPFADEAFGEEQFGEEQFGEEQFANEASAEESSTEGSSAEEPFDEKPITEETITEEPITEEPITEEPNTKKLIAEEPNAKQLISEEPIAEEPNAKQLISEEQIAEEPNAKQLICEEQIEIEESDDEYGDANTDSSKDESFESL